MFIYGFRDIFTQDDFKKGKHWYHGYDDQTGHRCPPLQQPDFVTIINTETELTEY